MPEDDGGGVNYSVKELIGAIDGKLDHVIEKLDTKANQADFVALRERQVITEQRIAEFTRFRNAQELHNQKVDDLIALYNEDRSARKAISNDRKWIWINIIVTGILVAATLTSHFFH